MLSERSLLLTGARRQRARWWKLPNGLVAHYHSLSPRRCLTNVAQESAPPGSCEARCATAAKSISVNDMQTQRSCTPSAPAA